MFNFIEAIFQDIDWENNPKSNLAQIKKYVKENGFPIEPYEPGWFTLLERLGVLGMNDSLLNVFGKTQKDYNKIKTEKENWIREKNKSMGEHSNV